jgi:hypothetical protein
VSDVTDPNVALCCGACAALRPDVRPTTLATLYLQADGHVRVQPIVRTSGKPAAAQLADEAVTGQKPGRGRRTFASPPGPAYAPGRAISCRSCDLDRFVSLKKLAASVARAIEAGHESLWIAADGGVAPPGGWR